MFTLSLLFMIGYRLLAQGFYDMDTIQTIEITFAESNWDALLDAQKSGDENYIMAQSVAINGAVFDSVGVKYKGNSTYSERQVKNPFHIELDTYKEQNYQGYTDIKLSNAAMDPSFLREVLSYHIIRQYMDAPLSNFANVYVNGTLIGLYSNSEAVSKKFVKSRFGSKKNAFFKCNPIDGAGPGTGQYPNLVYLGQDSTSYSNAYEMNSDAGWQDLIDLCDTLSNHSSEVHRILDVNRALWMLALDNVLVNLDSYIGAFTQNYYLYRDDNDRFVPVIWDLNESFGRFSQTGSSTLNSTSQKQQMSHLLHQSDASYPLVKNLLSDARYKRMYLAHCKTILLENFDNKAYFTTGQALQNSIDASVKADNNKFFTYANFLSNLSSDVSSGTGPRAESTVGIASLMNGRSAYLLGLSDFTKTEPEFGNIALSKSEPVVNDSIFISAKISDATDAYLGYRNNAFDVFEQYEMYDDGAHGDGAANDGTFGVKILVRDTENQYYIYAENTSAGMFSPRRAEHDYYSFTATYNEIVSSALVINELLASNSYTMLDQNGEYDDWIELYNNSAEAIVLDGYHLSDDEDDILKWTFPAGTTIAAHAYLIVWADKDTLQSGLHASFKLSASGETVFLSDAFGQVIDEISFGEQTTDMSYGRYENGTGSFQVMSPTYNAENNVLTGVKNTSAEAANVSVWPNPMRDVLSIDAAGLSFECVSIYDLTGRECFNQNGAFTNGKIQLNLAHLPNGTYLIILQGEDGREVIKLIKQD